jgi:hypothetical protein
LELRADAKALSQEERRLRGDVESLKQVRDARLAALGNLVDARAPDSGRGEASALVERWEAPCSICVGKQTGPFCFSSPSRAAPASLVDAIAGFSRTLLRDRGFALAADKASAEGASAGEASHAQFAADLAGRWILGKDLPIRTAARCGDDQLEVFLATTDARADGDAAFEELRTLLSDLCRGIGLPHRIVNVESRLLPRAAARQLRVEVRMHAQGTPEGSERGDAEESNGPAPVDGTWRRLASCTAYTDFCARAHGIRIGSAQGKKLGINEKRFVHTFSARLPAAGPAADLLAAHAAAEFGISAGGGAVPSAPVPEALRAHWPAGWPAATPDAAAGGVRSPRPEALGLAPGVRVRHGVLDGECEAMDRWLRRRSYLPPPGEDPARRAAVSGFRPSSADAAAATRFGPGGPRAHYASLRRWFEHVRSFSEEERAAWPDRP